MGIEHSCHNCGQALGHIHAPLDPIYRLPLVVCPVCTTACIRRVPEFTRFIRAFRRTFAAVSGLAWRIGVCVILLFGALGLSEGLLDSLRGLRITELASHFAGIDPIPGEINAWREENGVVRLVVWAAWFIVIGASLAIGPAHLRRWAAWLAFIALIALSIGGWVLVRSIEHYKQVHLPWDDGRAFFAQWRQVRPTAEYVAGGLIIAPLGIPLGRRLRRSSDGRTARRWIKRLRKTRKRRLAL